MSKQSIEGKPIDMLRVATDTTWHDNVAHIMNDRTPGAVTVFEENGSGQKGYEFPQASPFRALTRAAQNFDVALREITSDDKTRAKEVKKAINKVYRDQTRKKWGRREGK